MEGGRGREGKKPVLRRRTEKEKKKERKREGERAAGEEGGGEGEEREHPITAANTRATVIARPRPYLLFTWLPALCTRTTIPFQRLEPLETLARTRIAPYVVDLLPAAFYSSLSLSFSMRHLVSISPSLSFLLSSSSFSFHFGNGGEGRERPGS